MQVRNNILKYLDAEGLKPEDIGLYSVEYYKTVKRHNWLIVVSFNKEDVEPFSLNLSEHTWDFYIAAKDIGTTTKMMEKEIEELKNGK